MRRVSSAFVSIGGAVFSLALVASSAQADPVLPNLTNLDFLTYTGSAPKAEFTAVDPTGWTGGSGLIFIATPGGTSNPNSACGSTYLQTYGCPSTLAISGGYNEVEADGNPTFGSGFNTTITGLTAGTTYQLSFYQAASQQTTFNGATTEQWIVALGGSGFTVCDGCGAFDPTFGSNESTYSDAGASIAATTLMSTPSHGLTDWNQVTVDLTANGPTDLLSFLAWGDDGTTNNLPPMVFLTAVNAPAGLTTPEPGTLSLFALGFIALGVSIWRMRANGL